MVVAARGWSSSQASICVRLLASAHHAQQKGERVDMQVDLMLAQRSPSLTWFQAVVELDRRGSWSSQAGALRPNLRLKRASESLQAGHDTGQGHADNKVPRACGDGG